MKPHIVYYEPDYSNSAPNLWQLRGRYKYPSIVGDLSRTAQMSMLMHTLPPRKDPIRRHLEGSLGLRFFRFKKGVSFLPESADVLARHLAEELERLKPSVVSNLNGRTISYCYASALAAQSLGVRYVMRVGGDDLGTKVSVAAAGNEPFQGTWRYHLYLLQERVAAELAADIIVMTRKEGARLARIVRKPDKIHVCYRGVDQTKFAAAGPKAGPCRRILFIGRRSAEKGYDICEAVARRIWADRQDIRFTFAGTFDKSVEENRDYIGFVGVDDLPKLYAQHDALIVCSRSEGFPQVVMEAMSMGLPCILSKHLFDVDFTDGDTAMLSDATPEAMTRAVLTLANDNERFQTLARRALDYALTNFSATAMNDLYKSIMVGSVTKPAHVSAGVL